MTEAELSFSEWWKVSERTLRDAKTMTSELFVRLGQNKLEEQMNPDAGLDQVVRAQKQKRERVYSRRRRHQNVIDASHNCIEELARCSKKAIDSITQLTHERYKGTANIQINEVRQELRAGRPKAELFRDILDEALDAEKKCLEKQRATLLKLEEEGKDLLKEIAEKRGLLTKNSGARRVNMLQDISSLNQKVAPLPEKKKADKADKADKAEKEEESNYTPNKELSEESKQILAETYDLLERCWDHRKQSVQTVRDFSTTRELAKARSEASLNKRVEHLGERKAEMETQLRELRSSVTKAQRELESSFRKLNPSDAEKKEKLECDRDLLNRLIDLRDELDKDVRNKAVALEIDYTCKRVNAAKAGEAKLKKEQKELSKTEAPPPTRSTSCPALRKPEERPDSGTRSPGGSRPLKAGGAAVGAFSP